MNLGLAIEYLFPSVDFENGVRLQNDGHGVYIAKWDESLGKKPTAEELEVAYALYLVEQVAEDKAQAYIAKARVQKEIKVLKAAKIIAQDDSEIDAILKLEDKISKEETKLEDKISKEETKLDSVVATKER